jgi:hypothetical protein
MTTKVGDTCNVVFEIAGSKDHGRAQRVRRVRRLETADEERLSLALDRTIDEVREQLALEPADPDEPEAEEGADGAAAQETPDLLFTSLIGAKGLSAEHVFIVGLNDGHLPRNSTAIDDDEICGFLVGLSRTRKRCHLISYRFFAKAFLPPRIFLRWIADRLEILTVNKDYDFSETITSDLAEPRSRGSRAMRSPLEHSEMVGRHLHHRSHNMSDGLRLIRFPRQRGKTSAAGTAHGDPSLARDRWFGRSPLCDSCELAVGGARSGLHSDLRSSCDPPERFSIRRCTLSRTAQPCGSWTFRNLPTGGSPPANWQNRREQGTSL